MQDEDRIVSVVRANAASLLRLARKHSLCEDDAADAYQRTLEIYLERVERIDHASAGAWLRTVCKHEAMRLRAARQRVLTPEAVEWDRRPADAVYEGPERAESLERVARAAEALQACRPEEAKAMLLRADGSSYAEISAQCGWSYSKVNRALANGRARFLRSFARIESGAACAGYERVLSAIVDGEATPEDFLALRPHLRHCSGCRATLKAMYDAEPALGALMPAGVLALAAPGPLARGLHEFGERVVRLHAFLETASAGKAAAVVASTAAVAAGGAAAVEHAERAHPPALAAAHVVHVHRQAPVVRSPAATPSPGVTAVPTATVIVTAPAPTSVPTVVPTATASPGRVEFAPVGAGGTSAVSPGRDRDAPGALSAAARGRGSGSRGTSEFALEGG